MARTKGVGFTNVRSFVLGGYGGPSAWDAVLGAFPRAEREVLEAAVAIGWYDLDLYARLITEVDRRFGQGDLRLVEALGRYEAEKDLTTIHQWLLRFFNPALAIEQMGKYWSRFHDTGQWVVERKSEREIQARLSGWGVIDPALCRELCGYFQRTLELIGGRDVRVEHPRCRARGAGECEFRAHYGLKRDLPSPPPTS
ncbi:MAG: V4R domain-containing protein [Byssovorax sp.]